MDEPDDFNKYLNVCHQNDIDFTKYLYYDPVSALIGAFRHSKGLPLNLGRVHTVVAEILPNKAGNKSFMAKVGKALKKYSHENAKKPTFRKKAG